MGFWGKIFVRAGRVLSNGAAKCEKYAARCGAMQDTVKVAQNTAARKPVNVPNMFDTIKAKADAMPLALPAPTAEQLAAARPRLNTGKLFGFGSDQLHLSQEIAKDGTHIRYYRMPGNNRIVLKTADKGLLHQEWAYGNRAGDLTYLKTVGDDVYLLREKDGITEIAKRTKKYKDGIDQTLTTQSVIGNGMNRTRIEGFNGAVDDNVAVNYINRFSGKPKKVTFPLTRRGIDYSSTQTSNTYNSLWSECERKIDELHDFIRKPLGFLDDLLSPFES